LKVKLKFLGAAQQVTGSCYFIESENIRLIIDCGLFQERKYLERNWAPFPVPPEEINVLLLSHVHLDHSGLLPKFVREGFSGPIMVTPPSKKLLPIVLLDSARIQEEDAAYKKKRHKREGRKGPYPEIPLYTVKDAERVFPLVKDISYKASIPIGNRGEVRFYDAGHILGAAILEVALLDEGVEKTLVFSGDLGQWNRPLMRDPSVFSHADYVVMESTYGDREHEDPLDVEEMLCKIIKETVARGGNIVIPTFAIERAQELLFHLSRLASQDKIPYLMAFLDSPMAVDVTEVFMQHKEYMDNETLEFIRQGHRPFNFPGLKFARTVPESKTINSIRGSCIILAGSGMCTGGRIKHHLVQNISRPESTILFVGYQAEGTLGRQIVEGKPEVRILGKLYPVRARVAQIQGFSAHADRADLLRWLEAFREPPRHLFLTHGEKQASQSIAEILKSRKGWKVEIPQYLQEWEL
jgi:metallo-beta-lactamase family protein